MSGTLFDSTANVLYSPLQLSIVPKAEPQQDSDEISDEAGDDNELPVDPTAPYRPVFPVCLHLESHISSLLVQVDIVLMSYAFDLISRLFRGSFRQYNRLSALIPSCAHA
jgi:hypothetical protein